MELSEFKGVVHTPYAWSKKFMKELSKFSPPFHINIILMYNRDII